MLGEDAFAADFLEGAELDLWIMGDGGDAAVADAHVAVTPENSLATARSTATLKISGKECVCARFGGSCRDDAVRVLYATTIDPVCQYESGDGTLT